MSRALTAVARKQPGQPLKVTIPSGVGFRRLHIVDGDVSVLVWKESREQAVSEADSLAKRLARVLAFHPHGVPFDRSRAQ